MTDLELRVTNPRSTDREFSLMQRIRVRGARVHNLKNINVDIPRDRLVVITGPSGSGKSSLAFDTIFAEGQRQYVESLSLYARQFLDQMQRPDVDWIDGLQPAIAIDQCAGRSNPRSTVATITEIYDFLRLLMARVGQPYCYQCGEPISQQTPEEIQDLVENFPEGTKAMVMAPLVRGRKGKHQEVLKAIRKAGFIRARIDGKICDLDEIPELASRKAHDIAAVVDRFIIREGISSRLIDSIRCALQYGDGLVQVICLDTIPTSMDYQKVDRGKPSQVKQTDGGQTPAEMCRERVFSTRYTCPTCQISFEELEPRTFSFNSPYGACPSCQGLGTRWRFDPDLVVPDKRGSLAEGVVVPWKRVASVVVKQYQKELKLFLNTTRIGWNTPWTKIQKDVYDRLLRGDGKKFHGILSMLEKEYATTTSRSRIDDLKVFRGPLPCVECQGTRLRREARACRLEGYTIDKITAMSVGESCRFFAQLNVGSKRRSIVEPIRAEITSRLAFLKKVGVEYLSLNRAANSLSGGEMQRIRLATGMGSGLVGICYLLDEPTIGLHPCDSQRLLDALRDFQIQGNTVIVVEHDEFMMRHADHLIDMGPGAGVDGGHVVAQGTPQEVAQAELSMTGRYLRGDLRISVPHRRRHISRARSLYLTGATTNNLKAIDVRFPLAALVCVTGVSGSGKSSLVNETLSRAVGRRLGQRTEKPGPHIDLRGVQHIDRLVEVDQTPIGRTPRSTPATYLGVFDDIRRIFAETKESQRLGYRASRFSFNVPGGRCELCRGQGIKKIEMNFLPDLFAVCSSCKGLRFNPQTLKVRYRDRSIADVLNMQAEEALELFENQPKICRRLLGILEVGLGYVPLGQPSTTFSGGEAQRIKLAAELVRRSSGGTFYILDEPTTGLHFGEVDRLLTLLNRLVDRGNTVLVVEHNLDVVKSADWIIDMGPEGGPQGGCVVATGTPEEVADVAVHHTAKCLRNVFDQKTSFRLGQ